jgi:aspartokinase/homoserine dehydrogenase 1
MKVMTLGSSALRDAAQISRMAGVIDSETAGFGGIIVLQALPGVQNDLAGAARMAASGDVRFADTLRVLEARHLEIVRQEVHIKRQSKSLAGLKFEFNRLCDIVDGVGMIGELSPRTLDKILGFGEWFSAYIFLEAVRERRPEAILLDTREVIVTDSRFGTARVLPDESRERIRKKLLSAPEVLRIATGSLGATRDGAPTTLGRGGCEYTASVLASSLGAEEMIIWSDTAGILTADPKKVPAARTIGRMSYVEAMEMTHFGGEFIYPPAMIPAMKAGIRVRVRNAFDPGFQGTIICERGEEGRTFTGISSSGEVALLQLSGSGMIGVTGVSMRLFSALAKAGVNVRLISQASSEHSICAGISAADAAAARGAVAAEFAPELDSMQIDEITVEEGLAIVAVVGENMVRSTGIAARVFSALGGEGINVRAIAQGSSELNISVVIGLNQQGAALKALHRELIERGTP